MFKIIKKPHKYIIYIILLVITALYSSSIINSNRSINKNNEHFTRACQHLKEISKDIHPYDSEEIKSVRNYITNQLDLLGADYEVLNDGYKVSDWIEQQVEEYETAPAQQRSNMEAEATSYNFSTFRDFITDVARFKYGSPDAELPMYNILVRVDGTGDKGIMLVAHYDTSYGSYGAGDDGAAVAGMIEAIRSALDLNRANDLYFLFTDGEEQRLWGARAFVLEHPEYKDKIAAVFNCEGRGSEGTPILFETSEGNSGLVSETSKALKYETGYSFIVDIYRYMPNCSDLNEFMDAGYAGLNFAFSGLEENNHQLSDTYDNLSEEAIYDMVMLEQELVEYYADSDLSKLASDKDAVFLPVIRGSLLVIPDMLVLLLKLCAVVVVAAVIFLSISKMNISLKKVIHSLASLLILAIAIFITIIVIGLPASINYLIMQDRAWTDNPDLIGFVNAGKLHYIFFWVQLAVSLIITYLFVRFIKIRLKADKELMLVCLLFGAVITLITSFVLKGLNYISVLPVLITAIIILISWKASDKVKSKLYILAAYSYTAITAFLLVPLVEAGYRGLRLSYIFWITPVLAIVLALPMIPGLILLEDSSRSAKNVETM